MLKNKTKLELLVIGLIIIAVVGFAFFSNDGKYKVEAKRITLYNGDLYTLSSLYGNEQITFSKDVKVFFEQKGDKILIGKGFKKLNEDDYYDAPSSDLFLVNADGKNEIQISKGADVIYAVMDRNAENIVYQNKSDELYQYNTKTNKLKLIVPRGNRPTFSPDGGKIVYGKYSLNWQEGEGTLGITVFDLKTGKEKIIVKNMGGNAHFTPDGKNILFAADGINLVDVEGLNQIQLSREGDGIFRHGEFDDPVWSSDGKYFVYEFNNEIIVAEIDLQNRKLISVGAIAYGKSPEWVEEKKTLSVFPPNAEIGAESLSVVDLNGKVLSGDKSKESKYYKNGKSLLRVKPTPVIQ